MTTVESETWGKIKEELQSAKEWAVSIKEFDLAANIRDIEAVAKEKAKPRPPVKVLRPWTAAEAIAHRDWWFRMRGDAYWQRVQEIRPLNAPLAFRPGYWTSLEDMRDRWECAFDPSISDIEPCGVLEDQPAN